MSGLYVIGFTGTRNGMTRKQLTTVQGLLADATAFHHGDCVGADAEAHHLVTCRRVLHPPTDEKLRAFCPVGPLDEILPAKPYLERNKDIVRACDLLVAAPSMSNGRVTSRGTWSTVLFAGEIGRPCVWVEPGGRYHERMP